LPRPVAWSQQEQTLSSRLFHQKVDIGISWSKCYDPVSVMPYSVDWYLLTSVADAEQFWPGNSQILYLGTGCGTGSAWIRVDFSFWSTGSLDPDGSPLLRAGGLIVPSITFAES
jgi:hypothetical protein